MAMLRLSRRQHTRVSIALEEIAEVVGDHIAVTIVLHNIESPWLHYQVTDGPPDAYEIKWKVEGPKP